MQPRTGYSKLAVKCVQCEKMAQLAGLPEADETSWQLEDGIARNWAA